MTWGMPYTGSKNKIAQQIIDFLPSAEHFYDLFGGGGSITHCALLSGKYKYVHYNELDPLIFKGFRMAVNGDFKNETRWVSREDFNRLKNSDPYVAICFSFSNNLKTYTYSRQKEDFKKSLHDFLFFNDKNGIEKYVPINIVFTSNDVNTKRLEFQRYLKKYTETIKDYCNCANGKPNNILHSLERLHRLQELHCLQGVNNIYFTNDSYDNIKIENDSVIYCDPPYTSMHKYRIDFDFDNFYSWAKEQNNIYISEYKMPEDFKEVLSIPTPCMLSRYSHKIVQEKVFTNKNTFEKLNKNSLLGLF